MALAEAAQYARGYGLRFLYVIQNIAQLRTRYGADGAQDILDNVGAEIVFGTNDLQLTKELSERLGDNTIDVVTKNRPRFWASLNWQKQSEAEHERIPDRGVVRDDDRRPARRDPLGADDLDPVEPPDELAEADRVQELVRVHARLPGRASRSCASRSARIRKAASQNAR